MAWLPTLSCFSVCLAEDAITGGRIDQSHNGVTNASDATQHSQIKFRLIYWILCGEIEHSAASDFSSILWVKCCLGNLEKKADGWGGVGWGRLLRGSWTIVYCQWRVLNEKTVQEEKRKAGEATDSRLGWFVLLFHAACSYQPLSMRDTPAEPSISSCHVQNQWEMGELKVLCSASHIVAFSVVFTTCSGIIKNKTRKKTLVWHRHDEAGIPTQLWCYSPSFGLKLHQLAHDCLFQLALAFKLQRKHSLKCVAQRKKKKFHASPLKSGSHKTHTISEPV